MARAGNPFYRSPYPTDPGFASIGGTIATALFGDPELAAQQALRKQQMDSAAAQAEADRARAGESIEKTRGIRTQNDASVSLPEMFANWFKPQPTQVAPPVPLAPPAFDVGTPGGDSGLASLLGEAAARDISASAARETMDGPSMPSGFAPMADDPRTRLPSGIHSVDLDQFRAGLPAVVAALAQAQGDKVDPNNLVGLFASMMGDDEMARRGMVGMGKTPDKDFALTPDRADSIRSQGYDADLTKATGVADIQAGASRYGADQRLKGSKYSADQSSSASRYGADRRLDGTVIKEQGAPVSDAASVLKSIYPNARMTQNARDPNSALGKANPGSWHNKGNAALDVTPISGMTFNQYIQGYRDKGYTILEAKNEVGAGRSPWATGDHWHVVLGQQNGKGGKAPKTIAVTGTVSKGIQDEMDRSFGITRTKGVADKKFDQAGVNRIRSRAAQLYQQNGNIPESVSQAIKEAGDRNRARKSQAKAPAPAASGGKVVRYNAQGQRIL